MTPAALILAPRSSEEGRGGDGAPEPAMPSAQGPQPIRGPEDFAEVFKVPRETIHRLETLCRRCSADWQKPTNLVSASHPAPSSGRAISPIRPNSRSCAQAQTLAGPRIRGRLSRACRCHPAKPGRPDFRMHLVESNGKKCAFLAEVARETEAPVDIHAMRIEELAESAHGLSLTSSPRGRWRRCRSLLRAVPSRSSGRGPGGCS